MSRLALPFLCAGCSLFLVHGPPANVSGADVKCTESSVAPAVDAVIGTLGVVGALGGELANQVSDPSKQVQNFELIIGLPSLVTGIVFLVAASHGNHAVDACREAKHGERRGCDGCPPALP